MKKFLIASFALLTLSAAEESGTFRPIESAQYSESVKREKDLPHLLIFGNMPLLVDVYLNVKSLTTEQSAEETEVFQIDSESVFHFCENRADVAVNLLGFACWPTGKYGERHKYETRFKEVIPLKKRTHVALVLNAAVCIDRVKWVLTPEGRTTLYPEVTDFSVTHSIMTHVSE